MPTHPSRSPSALLGLPAVVAANLLPLVGVVAWGWSLGTLLVLGPLLLLPVVLLVWAGFVRI